MKQAALWALLALSCLLAACGGGDYEDEDPAPPPPTTTIPGQPSNCPSTNPFACR